MLHYKKWPEILLHSFSNYMKMLKTGVLSLLGGRSTTGVLARGKIAGKIAGVKSFKRLQSKLSSEPQEILTTVSDTEDPQRLPFYRYSWGSWLKNDKLEKKKRETKFSIEGIASLVQDLSAELKKVENVDKNGKPVVKPPKQLDDGTFVLSNNLTQELLGDSKETLLVKSIASIHEGKHHRIYKLTLSTGKELVLRIPYKLESMYSVSQKIKSEVATLDFFDLKLKLNVPKVLAYSYDSSNALQSAFILMEYIEGTSLMREWDPIVSDEVEKTEKKLESVIKPMASFQAKLLGMTFNQFGSLYFYNDVNTECQGKLPYEGEDDVLLKNRWRIGPSVHKSFSKNKVRLSKTLIEEYSRPIDATKPLDVVKALCGIELENLRHRLALSQSDSSDKVENLTLLKKAIATFENLNEISSKLLNPSSNSIMNVEELFKPKLNVLDLDPINVIFNKNNCNELYFVDFEYTCIMPFILTNYPSFVAYQGAKIYNLEEDIPGFNELDDMEKDQYKFMYYKTRNERMWETELNSHRHDLIAVASPFIKALKNPLIQATNFKTDKDHLYIEEAIIQLQAMWDAFVANGLCNSTESKFPIKYSADYLDEHQADLLEYQMKTVSEPFAATGGWIPQDMFDGLKEQGIIVELEDGNFKVETEKML